MARAVSIWHLTASNCGPVDWTGFSIKTFPNFMYLIFSTVRSWDIRERTEIDKYVLESQVVSLR